MADEEGSREGVFELLNSNGQGRLGEGEFLSGRRNVFSTADFEEGLDLI